MLPCSRRAHWGARRDPREVAVRKILLVALAVVAAAALALPASAGQSGQARTAAQAQPSGQLQSANGEYVVAYADGASTAAAHAAVKAAGGTIVKENTRVGVATVRSANPAFVRAAAGQRALVGAARNRPIGRIPSGSSAAKDEVERLTAAERAAPKAGSRRAGRAPGPPPPAAGPPRGPAPRGPRGGPCPPPRGPPPRPAPGAPGACPARSPWPTSS